MRSDDPQFTVAQVPRIGTTWSDRGRPPLYRNWPTDGVDHRATERATGTCFGLH
jgi:hypothetical protein